jgi:hypothetical protein
MQQAEMRFTTSDVFGHIERHGKPFRALLQHITIGQHNDSPVE